MSDQITFTGVVLKSFSRDKNGGKAVFHANFTEPVSKAMGWGGFTKGQTDVTLEGSLASASLTLQPKDGELAAWLVEFKATAIKGFEALRLELEGHKGKGHRYELRFVVQFVDPTACRFLEEFITSAGEAKSTLKVTYTKQAEQSDLPLQSDEAAQATLASED